MALLLRQNNKPLNTGRLQLFKELRLVLREQTYSVGGFAFPVHHHYMYCQHYHLQIYRMLIHSHFVLHHTVSVQQKNFIEREMHVWAQAFDINSSCYIARHPQEFGLISKVDWLN